MLPKTATHLLSSVFAALFLLSTSALATAGNTNGDSTNVSGSINDLIAKGNEMLTNQQFGAAIPLWEQIVRQDTGNSNLNFKMGLCYRNSLDQQVDAVPFFRKAVENMTVKYNFQDRALTEAPVDALYFLAESYLAANQPDSAYKYYQAYQDFYNGQPPIAVDHHMLMCSNAQRYLKMPRNVTIRNMGDVLNTGVMEANPVITIDNSVVFFSSRRLRPDNSNADVTDAQSGKYFRDIYYSMKNEQGEWGEVKLFKHSTAGTDDAPLCLSADGSTLYYRTEEAGINNLYESHFEDGVWSEPKALAVNSPYNEIGMSISGDGKHMYFSSDREGGIGSFDIYHAELKSNGKWGKAENLGDVINTDYNEVSPFVHPNGKTLFFSSNGNLNKGMGGLDVYYSSLEDDGSWSEPATMGYPINTTRDDLNYYITEGGRRFYTNINKDNSYDLFEIEGGGFDVENLDAMVEVVTLTEEMDVTEVLEVVEETEVEVEVVETVETVVYEETEVEVVDLEAFTEFEEELPVDTAETAVADAVVDSAEVELEELPSIVEQINMEELTDVERELLIQKVKDYLTAEVENTNSAVFKTVYFDFGSANLSMLSAKELEVMVEYLAENPTHKVEIVGHTDNVGGWGTNLNLSAARAKEVYQFLLRNKISADRIIYYGKGSGEPIATNDNDAGRRMNRRVEVKIVK